MKSHNITLFNFLSILCCFGLSLLFFSCSGLGGEKTSGAVSFSFDARSLVSSLEENLQENDIPTESLQEVNIQMALLGGGGGIHQTLKQSLSQKKILIPISKMQKLQSLKILQLALLFMPAELFMQALKKMILHLYIQPFMELVMK